MGNTFALTRNTSVARACIGGWGSEGTKLGCAYKWRETDEDDGLFSSSNKQVEFDLSIGTLRNRAIGRRHRRLGSPVLLKQNVHVTTYSRG